MRGLRRESIIESQVVLLVAHAIGLTLGLLITFLLVRRLDAQGFSAFVLVSGALALASQLVDAGLQPAVVAELSKNQASSVAFLHRVVRQRLILALVAISMAMAAASLLPRELEWWLFAAAILCLPLRTMAAHFAANRRNRVTAWGGLAIRGVFCALIAAIVQRDGDVLALVLTAFLGREIVMSVYPCVMLRWFSPATLAADSTVASPVRGLAFLAAATMFSAAYFHIDVFMLRAMSNVQAVADYGLAVRVLGPVVVAASLLLAPYLPFLSGRLKERQNPHPNDVALTAIACLGAMLPLSMVLLQSMPIVYIVSGEKSEPAASALAMLATAVPFMVLGMAYSTALIMAKRYRSWTAITLLGLVTNLLLNWLWIPDLGGDGAARATVCTEVLIAVLALVSQRFGARASSDFSSTEVGGAFLAAMAPGAVALAIYLAVWPDSQHTKLLLASGLAVTAAATHLLVGVARSLRHRFEARKAIEEEAS